MEEQACSLELANRLNELGVKQESQFFWVNDGKELEEGQNRLVCVYRHWTSCDSPVRPNKVAAFTSAELGEMLPHYLDTNDAGGAFDLISRKAGPWWVCEYAKHELPWNSHNRQLRMEDGNTEADARAKMLVYLCSSGLL